MQNKVKHNLAMNSFHTVQQDNRMSLDALIKLKISLLFFLVFSVNSKKKSSCSFHCFGSYVTERCETKILTSSNGGVKIRSDSHLY